jgi:hypothetical protein
MALMMDGKGDQAVKRLSKVTAVEANVITRLNGERLRIHYPRELALRVLKPNTEPILRKDYRLKAKQIAQEVKDTNAVVGNLFRKGGRNGGPQPYRQQLWKKSRRQVYPSFPQNQRKRPFKQFRPQGSQPYQNRAQNNNTVGRKPPQ